MGRTVPLVTIQMTKPEARAVQAALIHWINSGFDQIGGFARSIAHGHEWFEELSNSQREQLAKEIETAIHEAT